MLIHLTGQLSNDFNYFMSFYQTVIFDIKHQNIHELGEEPRLYFLTKLVLLGSVILQLP